MRAIILSLALCAVSVSGLWFPSFPPARRGVSVCYWGSWSIYRPDLGTFGINELPTDLCTHLVWTFLGVDAETAEVIELEPQAVSGEYTNNITQFVALREQNPDLKLIVAAGGYSAGSLNFSTVANNETLRAKYVENTVAFLKHYDLDGFDLDWEYPVLQNGSATDLEAFVYLLESFKAAFEDEYELLVTVAASSSYIGTSYLVPNISATVDYINIMAYDFHGTWENVTGVNAPLYRQLTDDESSTVNVNASIHAWIDAGAAPSKLVLGIGAYGRSFNLTSLDNTSTGTPFNGAGEAGPYTQSAGTLTYYEICLDQLENESEWSITEVEGNYVYGNRGYLWVGYDNVNTVYAKGQYAKKLGLAGVMFWAVDFDDFANYCGDGKFPIITNAVNGYNHG